MESFQESYPDQESEHNSPPVEDYTANSVDIDHEPTPDDYQQFLPTEEAYTEEAYTEEAYTEEPPAPTDDTHTLSYENTQIEENQTSPSPPPSNQSTEASEPTQIKENRFFGKIFVGGLGRNTTEETLKAYFEPFGNICESNVIVDKTSGRSRGFGFITFDSDAAVKSCLEQKHYVDGVKVDVRNAVPREEAKDNTPNDPTDHPGRVFVGGLSEEVTEDQFKEFFQQFGALKSSNLMYDKDHHKPRGFGFVIFENPEDADKSLGVHETLGRNCEAKKALPKPAYTRPKPTANPLWNPHSYLPLTRPFKHAPRIPPISHYREPSIYDSVDPYYLSAYGSHHYDHHMYPPQNIHPYYSSHDPIMPHQGYGYGYTPPPHHSQINKYQPPPSRGDLYSPMDLSIYGAERSRRNPIRTHPY